MAMYMLNGKQEDGTAWSYITVEGLKQEVYQKAGGASLACL